MRTDKYMMAKAWMKQDQAPQSEALDTWNTLEAEFNEERKAMLMASAETDKIKEEMNKQFGSGTVKYGSEIKQPEIKTPQAIFEFSQRNPAAEGGEIRQNFGDGTPTKRADGQYTMRLYDPVKGGANKITYVGSEKKLLGILKKHNEDALKRKENRAITNLSKAEEKIVLEWGKNKGKGKWSNKKIFQEFKNSDPSTRYKIRLGENTGLGGGNIKGSVKALTTEQQKLWDATMADEFGKWEDYNPTLNDDGSIKTNRRGNWLQDYPRKKEIFNQTKGLLSIDELSDYLSKKLGQKISKTKVYGRFGNQEKTALANYLDDNLYVDTFGSIKGGEDVGGSMRYFKKPTDTQINQIKKQNLAGDIRVNTLSKDTYDNVIKLDKTFRNVYTTGNVPKIEEVLAEFPNMGKQRAGYATIKLAQIYNGHKFRNNPPEIRVNKIAAKKMQATLEKFPFGHPYRQGIYNTAMQTIDEGLGQTSGTFDNLKKKARTILNNAGIDVYDPKMGKNAFGFNIDEFAGITGTSKTKNMAVSQFVNILEGGLNTKTLAGFQSQLSTARRLVEEAKAKGPEAYRKVLKEQMEKVNTRAASLEAEHGIKLARLERPADINNMSADEVKRLKNIKLGTDENLYQRLVKDAKASGYSIKVPEGSLTIQEFTDPDNKRARELIALVGCPNFKGKQVFAEGGRTGFSEGGDCFDKGQKLINNGMKGASPGSMKNAAKFLNNAYKFGRNVMKFGIIPEAIFVGAESIIRAGGDQTLDEGFKSAIGFYLDPILGTNFKSDARISQNLRNMTAQDTMDLEKLFKFNTATENLNKLKENQKNVLNVYDESLMGGVSEQDYKKQSDANIAKAQEELNKNFLTETQRVDFENKADTSEDIKGVRSPFRQAIGKARSDTEMMRYEDDFTGMQSDMFTQDPMSAKAKKDSLSNLLPQKGMTPRLSNFVNFDDRQLEQLSGLTKKPVKELQAYQEYLNKERAMSLLEQEKIFGKEQTYGTQGNFFGEQINKKPMYDYAEGGITGLRSKYEYKK